MNMYEQRVHRCHFTPAKLIVMKLHVKHIVQTLLDHKQWTLTVSQAKEYNYVIH